MLAALGGKVFDMTDADYSEAYRKVDRRRIASARSNSSCILGQSLDRLTRKPLIGTTAHDDARAGCRGWAGDLQDSLSGAIPRSAK